jgi:hypothetical protein
VENFKVGESEADPKDFHRTLEVMQNLAKSLGSQRVIEFADEAHLTGLYCSEEQALKLRPVRCLCVRETKAFSNLLAITQFFQPSQHDVFELSWIGEAMLLRQDRCKLAVEMDDGRASFQHGLIIQRAKGVL